ncbi:hypothetical protein NL676_009560 [Syzygium grande]|nr:hypothetical protein NL676_009560 [Syzygium grande]
MSSEGRGIGRAPRRGAGRGTRGGGRARVRAVDNIGINVGAAVDPRVDVRPVEDPRMEGVLRVLERIGNVLDRQAQGRDNAAAAAVEENQANAGQAQPAGVRQMPQLVEQFMKLKPPKFHGRGDPRSHQDG